MLPGGDRSVVRKGCSRTGDGGDGTRRHDTGLAEEGTVDEEIVVGVDAAVVVEVALPVRRYRRLGEDAGVDAELVVAVDPAVEVGVAVVRVLQDDGVLVHVLAAEDGEAEVSDCGERGESVSRRGGTPGAGAGSDAAGQARWPGG